MNGYITVKLIADDLADHPLLRDISYDRIINYAVLLIRLIGAPLLFIEKTAQINIKLYRGVLPCDFVEIISVRGINGDEYLTTMDNFFMAEVKPKFIGTKTYRIQGNVIFTSRPEEDVEVAYRAVPVDKDGFPMIVDNQEFIEALKAYIKVKRFEIFFDEGRISQAVFLNAQQDYAFRAGLAQTSFVRPNDDEMEVLANVVCSLIPRVQEHSNGFATAHNRQYIRQH